MKKSKLLKLISFSVSFVVPLLGNSCNNGTKGNHKPWTELAKSTPISPTIVGYRAVVNYLNSRIQDTKLFHLTDMPDAKIKVTQRGSQKLIDPAYVENYFKEYGKSIAQVGNKTKLVIDNSQLTNNKVAKNQPYFGTLKITSKEFDVLVGFNLDMSVTVPGSGSNINYKIATNGVITGFDARTTYAGFVASFMSVIVGREGFPSKDRSQWEDFLTDKNYYNYYNLFFDAKSPVFKVVVESNKNTVFSNAGSKAYKFPEKLPGVSKKLTETFTFSQEGNAIIYFDYNSSAKLLFADADQYHFS